MARDPRLWVAGLALALATCLVAPRVIAAIRPAPPPAAAPEIDYVCTESKEVFRLPAAEGILVNPRTGRATLVPAQFDARTKSWRPGPPPDVRQRMRQR